MIKIKFYNKIYLVKPKQFNMFRIKKNIGFQFFISTTIIIIVTFFCYTLKNKIEYRITAIILLFVVGVFAVTLDILPVLIASIFSALILNYFFIPPLFTFHIGSTDDVLLFLIFFIVAIINGILTYKIRSAEKKVREKEDKEKVIKLYNTLFNSLSHELRTPLATILASVDTIQEQRHSLTKIQQEILLQEIGIAGNRLNKQVENLLSMSRLETGMLQLKKSWCDINEILNEQINHFKKQAIINFNPNEKLPLVKIDIGLMEQVFQNILNNAIAYNPSNIIIQIAATIRDDKLLEIKIADYGNGVPNENLGQLFDKFYRVPNTVKGGTGLGLSIVKGYIEAHNGNIIATHSVPNGLQFIITIPTEISYINKLHNE